MDKFTFGIMGAGKIAVKFTEAARMAGAEVIAVASKSAARAAEFAGKNGIAASFGSYSELLERSRPDCVYIATTPDSHWELAMLCISRGVPVLCEKAMFVDSGEASSAITHANANRVFMMEALWSRFLPANKKACEWIASGMIGDVKLCQVNIGFRAPDGDDNRYWNKALAGGAARDITVYAYELARLYEPSPELGSDVAVTRFRTGVDATESALIRTERAVISLNTSFETNLADRAVIFGERGRIEIPHPHYAGEALLYDANGVLTESFTDTETVNGFTYEINEVIERVRAGETESAVVPQSLTLGCAKLFDRIDRA